MSMKDSVDFAHFTNIQVSVKQLYKYTSSVKKFYIKKPSNRMEKGTISFFLSNKKK